MECLCIVLYVWPVNHQQWLYMRLPLCLGSTCGQDTIVASVVKRKDGLEFPSFQFVPFSFLLSKTTKMENNRRVIPASLRDLDKERRSGTQTSKAVFRTRAEEQKASSFLAQSFLLKYFLWFDLVGWRAEVLFCVNQTQHKVICQKLCINLTDAPCTSSRCYVP